MPTISDILILIVYVTCVFYVINQAIKSLDKQFTVIPDQALINQQLQHYNIQDIVGLKFGFKRRYQYDGLKDISIVIQNKSSGYLLYVDWDHSALTDPGGRSRRVIRISTDLSPDLWRVQPFSVVDSGKSLQETITAEDILKRKADGTGYEIAKMLINPAKLDVGEKVAFSLRLAFRTVEYSPTPVERQAFVLCPFTLIKLPWTAFFPWNR
jgi:hypothetical protein